MQSTGESSSASHHPTRCADGTEGITKLKNSDSVVHIKYRTYSTSQCAAEEIFFPKETCHLDEDVWSVLHECLQHHLNAEHIMSPAVILEGTSWFIFHTRPDSALPCTSITPLKSLVLQRHFQNQSHNAFLPKKKKALTAKPAAPPVQFLFSENHSYHLGLNIFTDNYKPFLQSVWLSQFLTASN